METNNTSELKIEANDLSLLSKEKNTIFFLHFNNENQEILKLCENGDIFVKGRLAENDIQVVDALREFLKSQRLITVPNKLLGINASNQVTELISQGWEFTLHYGDNRTFCNIEEQCWEADFTRRKEDGLWDNHESGYGMSPDAAVDNAYQNIKNGIRLSYKRS